MEKLNFFLKSFLSLDLAIAAFLIAGGTMIWNLTKECKVQNSVNGLLISVAFVFGFIFAFKVIIDSYHNLRVFTELKGRYGNMISAIEVKYGIKNNQIKCSFCNQEFYFAVPGNKKIEDAKSGLIEKIEQSRKEEL